MPLLNSDTQDRELVRTAVACVVAATLHRNTKIKGGKNSYWERKAPTCVGRNVRESGEKLSKDCLQI